MIDIDFRKTLGTFSVDAAWASPSRGITALYGRSGAGKTTILRAIAGADTPDAGRIVIAGREFFDSAHGINLPVRDRRVGYVFQDSRLFPHMSVKGNLLYGYNRVRGARPRSLSDVVDLLDLASVLERRIHLLSGGERQRVAIGRALLAQPHVLLMDEPLSSLDPQRKSELLPYIESLRDDLGLPIVYISHAFNEVMRLADSLVIIDAGTVVRAGELHELAADPQLSPYLGRFEAGAVIECAVLGHDNAESLSRLGFPGGQLTIPLADIPIGVKLRVRIRARDVALSLSEPLDISIANRLPGRIHTITPQSGPFVDVSVDVGGTRLRALITQSSAKRLALKPDQSIWVLIKTVAFDGRSVGFRPRPRGAPSERA